jgi:hypothetical protein
MVCHLRSFSSLQPKHWTPSAQTLEAYKLELTNRARVGLGGPSLRCVATHLDPPVGPPLAQANLQVRTNCTT